MKRPTRSVEVEVQCATDPTEAAAASLPEEQLFTQWIQSTLAAEQRGGHITVRIVGEAEMTDLNTRYRGKPKSTNVLSFGADLPPEIDENYLGDLVICAPVVAREAVEQDKIASAHWCHMVVHGTLHLLGYDHETDSDAVVMEAREISILNKLGVANPYLESGAAS